MAGREIQINQKGLLPILQPLPIPTKDKSWFVAAWIWLTARRSWMLMEDYIWIGNGFGFYIPKGFIYDGASVPRVLWWLLSPMGLLLIPALFHDFGYAHGFYFKISRMAKEDRFYIIRVDISRKEADGMFRKISIIVNGISGPADIAWAGVRIGGWKAWNDHIKEREKLAEEIIGELEQEEANK
jgi:hypothetical protein